MQGLRASTVETNDLALAITTLGEELAAAKPIDHVGGRLHVEVEGTPRTLHPIVRDEIYRIASEALRNAFRHAEAKQIEVELRYDERQLRLRVRDDGKGIDPKFLTAEGRAGHFGLTWHARARQAHRRQAHRLDRAGFRHGDRAQHSRRRALTLRLALRDARGALRSWLGKRDRSRFMSSSENPIRILSVDDHPLIREGIAGLLAAQADMKLIGEAANGREAIQQFRLHRPDITLMDLQMPEMSGLDAIIAIRGEFPDARIIVLTTYAGDVQALRALQAGARAYLLKDTLHKELLDTIRAVHAGKKSLSPEVSFQLAEHLADDALTPAEIRVLRLIAEGNANKEIAAQLSSARTRSRAKSGTSSPNWAPRTEPMPR